METRSATARAPDAGAVDLLRLQVALLAHQGLARSATALATTLCDHLRCDRVMVGWLHHGTSRVVGVSHGADFDRRQPIIERAAAAMDEAVQQAASVVLPPPRDAAAQVVMAHLELAGHDAQRALCTVLLAAQGRVLGAMTLERAHPPFSADEVAFCEDAACLAALILRLRHAAERSWGAVTADALRRVLTSGGRRAKVALAATLGALAGLLLVPVPHHVAAPARLEGSIQRVVAAPVDGFLEQVNVRPGDAVSAGQVLAELSTRDLQAERVKRQSELAQHENVYKAALARADRTQLVINQARAAEAQAQLSLVESQLQRSQLRAPFDGVVIKGDLAQQLGAPVQRGEVLLTIAPDKRFRLIIEVDERDIALLRPGMAGRLALAASPGEVLDFRVVRVLPVAVSAEGRNFFEVEASFDAADRALRPGLRGVAKIAVGERAGAWILTHRLVDWLRLTAWSLGG